MAGPQYAPPIGATPDFGTPNPFMEYLPTRETPQTGMPAMAPPAASPQYKAMNTPFDPLFAEAEAAYPRLPKGLLKAVAQVESGFNPRPGVTITNPNSRHQGQAAQGLMQIMPATATQLGGDPNDPRQAVHMAARLLETGLTRWKGDLGEALKDYYGRGAPPAGHPGPDQHVQKVYSALAGYNPELVGQAAPRGAPQIGVLGNQLYANGKAFPQDARGIMEAAQYAQSGALGANPAGTQALQPDEFALLYGKATTPDATFGGAVKQFAAGALRGLGTLPQMPLELGAMAANKMFGTQLSGMNPLEPLAGALERTQTLGTQAARLNPAVEGNLLTGDWRVNPNASMGSIAMTLADGLGSMASFLGGAKMVQFLGTKALARLVPSAAPLGMTGPGAVAGFAQTAGGAMTEVEHELRGKTHDQLMVESPAYAAMISKVGDTAGGRQAAHFALIETAKQYAGTLSGALGAAGGAVGGHLAGRAFGGEGMPLLRGIKSMPGRVGAGAALGSMGEFVQEGAEQVGQNWGEGLALGQTIDSALLGRNTAPAAFGGALTGGVAGGGFSIPRGRQPGPQPGGFVPPPEGFVGPMLPMLPAPPAAPAAPGAPARPLALLAPPQMLALPAPGQTSYTEPQDTMYVTPAGTATPDMRQAVAADQEEVTQRYAPVAGPASTESISGVLSAYIKNPAQRLALAQAIARAAEQGPEALEQIVQQTDEALQQRRVQQKQFDAVLEAVNRIRADQPLVLEPAPPGDVMQAAPEPQRAEGPTPGQMDLTYEGAGRPIRTAGDIAATVLENMRKEGATLLDTEAGPSPLYSQWLRAVRSRLTENAPVMVNARKLRALAREVMNQFGEDGAPIAKAIENTIDQITDVAEPGESILKRVAPKRPRNPMFKRKEKQNVQEVQEAGQEAAPAPEGIANAFQEQSPAQVDARQQAGNGPTVGIGNTQGAATAGTSKAKAVAQSRTAVAGEAAAPAKKPVPAVQTRQTMPSPAVQQGKQRESASDRGPSTRVIKWIEDNVGEYPALQDRFDPEWGLDRRNKWWDSLVALQKKASEPGFESLLEQVYATPAQLQKASAKLEETVTSQENIEKRSRRIGQAQQEALEKGEDTTITKLERAAGTKPKAEVRYSEAEPLEKGEHTTKARIETALRKVFINPLFLRNKVEVISTESAAKERFGELLQDAKRPAAFTHGGRTYLIAENIARGHELAVFLHDIGVHLGMENLVGSANMEWLAKRVEEWANLDDDSLEFRVAQRATHRAVTSHSDPARLREELIAYAVEGFVEEGVNPRMAGLSTIGGWFRRLWDAVKKTLRAVGVDSDKFTPQDLVDLAFGAAELELSGTWHGGASFLGGKKDKVAFSEADGRLPPGASQVLHSLHDTIANIPPSKVHNMADSTRKAFLGFSTTFNIEELWREKFKSVDKFSQAHREYQAILSRMRDTANGVFERLDGWMSKNPEQEEDFAYVAHEASRLRVMPDEKSIDAAVAAAKDDALRVKDLQELRSRVGRLDKEARAQLAEAERLNRDMYARTIATLMKFAVAGTEFADAFPAGFNPLETTFNKFAPIIEALGEKAEESKAKKAAETEDAKKVRERLREIRADYRTRKDSPYFHLGRAGDFFVDFKVADDPAARKAVSELFALSGKGVTEQARRVFSRFETWESWGKVRKELDTLEKTGAITDYTAGRLEQSLHTLDNTQPEFIRRLVEQIKDKDADSEADKETKKEMLRVVRRLSIDILPESSPRRALAARKGTPGYDLDLRRNWAKRMETMIGSLANISTAKTFDDAFSAMRKELSALEDTDPDKQAELQQVMNELKVRRAHAVEPVEDVGISRVMQLWKAVGNTFFLALSPAYIITNLMQPMHLTYPILAAKYGAGKTSKAMFDATRKAWKIVGAIMRENYTVDKFKGVFDARVAIDKVKGLDERTKGIVNELIDSGMLEATFNMEMARAAKGHTGTSVDTVLNALSSMGHYSEVVNRLTTGIAAYELSNDPWEAVRTIASTQYDYSQGNVGRYLGKHGLLGSFTPVALSFQQYSFQTLELLFRLALWSVKGDKEARKALFGIMGTTMTLAGALGLPLVTVIAAAIDAVGGDDDEPMDSRAAVREWMAATFGKEAGELLSRGLPRAAGFDMSTRSGMQDLLPFSRFLGDKRALEDRMEDGAINMFGPSMGALFNMMKGVDKLSQGDIVGGLIQGSPLAVAGPLKAFKLADKGYTGPTGVKIPIEPSVWDITYQLFGFNPAAKAEQSEATFAVKSQAAQLQRRATALRQRMYRAFEEGDVDAQRDTLEEIVEFGTKNPDFALRGLGQGMRERARQTAAAEESGTGVLSPVRGAERLKQVGWAHTQR